MANIIVFAIVGGFIGVVVYLAIKSNKNLRQILETVPEEQKNRLALTDVQFVEGKNDEWYQEAMIYSATEKNGKMDMKLLWHNKVIQNNFYNRIQDADLKMKVEEYNNHNLKPGTYVKVLIRPTKSPVIKIIF